MASSIQQCVICYDELDRDLSAAPCGHVFHNVCIDRWHSHGSHCPMCHDNLPPKLLRLFFEPKQEAAKASAVASIESGILTGQTESSTANAKDDQHPQRASCDPEIIRLRRELASMTKLNDMTKDESTRLSRKLGEVHNELIETNVTHTISKQELEGQLKSTTANLRAAEINLFRANKENNQLKREMRGAQDMLRQFQGEKVALNFLHEVASKTTGARPRNGLGQVNLDEILRLISEGSAKADTVIKGQYDLLSGAIERERRTQRELNQSKAGYEAMELEVQKLRGKLLKSRKEGQRLTEALSSVGHEVLVVSPDRPGIGLLAKGAQSIQSPKDFQGGDCILPRRPDGGARRPADVSLVANSTDIMHETRRSPPAKRRASAVEGNDWTLEAQGSQVFSSHSFLGSTTASTGRTSRQKPGNWGEMSDEHPHQLRRKSGLGDVASTPFNGIGEYLVTQLLPMAFTAENPPAQGRWSHRNK